MLQVKESKVVHAKPGDRSAKFKRMVISVWPENETILQNLENRRCRPVNEFRKVLAPALKLVAKELSLSDEQCEILAKKARWSQKAGCNCGCSPGFKVDVWNRASMHITVSAQA